MAWVNIDGTGKPEYVTPEKEVAYGARLSPDNQRILCMVGPRATKGERTRTRLHVIDLTTKKRIMIDSPGHTYGYCWSSDGAKIAYTWQLPLNHPDDAQERVTFLITCDPNGGNRKVVTKRLYKVPQKRPDANGVIFFFQVLAWWR